MEKISLRPDSYQHFQLTFEQKRQTVPFGIEIKSNAVDQLKAQFCREKEVLSTQGHCWINDSIALRQNAGMFLQMQYLIGSLALKPL